MPSRPIAEPVVPKRHALYLYTIRFPSIQQPIADHRVHLVIAGAETSQLDFLSILDLLCITVSPLDGHVRVRICID